MTHCWPSQTLGLLEAATHISHGPQDHHRATYDDNSFDVLVNKDIFLPDPVVDTISDGYTKTTWRLAALGVRAHRRPSTYSEPTVTFCSVHFHSAVAKKRDASSMLLWRLFTHAARCHVDFVAGNFNVEINHTHMRKPCAAVQSPAVQPPLQCFSSLPSRRSVCHQYGKRVLDGPSTMQHSGPTAPTASLGVGPCSAEFQLFDARGSSA